MSGVVALVGRPNVGKSTLFNRLIEQQQAIVHNEPGVTRDRNYGICEWIGCRFTVIDTGGYVPDSKDLFESAIREQVQIALVEADLVLFMTDASVGLTPYDTAVADILRENHKNIFLVVNKVDNQSRSLAASEFYGLGLSTFFEISAISGSGTGDLLDAVVAHLPKQDTEEAETQTKIPKVAIVGKPNVGKSSLVNALLGYQNNIVTNIPGTTRDSIFTHYQAFGQEITLIDTAGLRKKAKVQENIEFYSTVRTLKAIEQCDVALVMIDATQGIERQDLNVIRHVEENRKGIILLVNKWDLFPDKETKTVQKYYHELQYKLQPATHIPILFVSATEKLRIFQAIKKAVAVFENRDTRIPTRKLNDLLLPIIAQKPPGSHRGNVIKIKYITQVSAKNPTFIFFANYPQQVKETYRRFLENIIRENFGFEGLPITVLLREK
ncbi:MAG: ribosome biogenesis GTPase Der [Bacteroidia bacterium]|nr:ribosome biogenesis GTPase Der [Bacteroidia bacterium]